MDKEYNKGKENKLFQIMTFDGGGIRGALVAALLRRLKGDFKDLLNNVDLFAGTSTGSAIALSLANKKSPEDLTALYSTKEMKFVFGKSRWNFLQPCCNDCYDRRRKQSKASHESA